MAWEQDDCVCRTFAKPRDEALVTPPFYLG
jgi:hypothetical protein